APRPELRGGCPDEPGPRALAGGRADPRYRPRPVLASLRALPGDRPRGVVEGDHRLRGDPGPQAPPQELRPRIPAPGRRADRPGQPRSAGLAEIAPLQPTGHG